MSKNSLAENLKEAGAQVTGRLTLKKHHGLLRRAVCKDEDTQLPLRGIHIRPGIAEASDGFVLVQMPIEYDGEPVTIRPPDRKLFRDDVIVEVGSNGKATYTGNGLSLEAPLIGGTFPDFDHVKQKLPGRRKKPQSQVALSPTLLRRLLACLPSDVECIRFYLHGASRGVYCEAESAKAGTVKAVLMPMFVRWEEERWAQR